MWSECRQVSSESEEVFGDLKKQVSNIIHYEALSSCIGVLFARESLSLSIHPLPHFYMCASVSMYVVFIHVCLCEPLLVGICVNAKGGRSVPDVSISTPSPWDLVFHCLWVKADKPINFSDPVVSDPHSSAGFTDTCVVCLHGCWESTLRPLTTEPL